MLRELIAQTTFIFVSTRSFEFVQTFIHVQISLAHNYSHRIAFHVRGGK